MKVFLSYRFEDKIEVEKIVSEINNRIRSIDFLTLDHYDKNWILKVTSLIREADLVLFFIGNDTHSSESIHKEYEIVKTLNKRFYFTELKTKKNPNISTYPNFCIDNKALHVANHPKEIIDALCYIDTSREILLEQYKILYASTENVSTRRQNVNNLYFGIITTVITASFLAADQISDKIQACLLLLFLTGIAFAITIYWKKLLISYQRLNSGKFELLQELEDKLKINLSQREWDILQDRGYVSNTETENKIVSTCRILLGLIAIGEASYFLWKTCLSESWLTSIFNFFHFY